MMTPEKSHHDDGMHMFPRHGMTEKRALVEVFSVQFITNTSNALERICGVILLRGSDQNYVLYEGPCDKRGPQYNLEGYFTLIGPECGVEVKDILVIYPWFFLKTGNCQWCEEKILWKRDLHLQNTNKVIRRGIKCSLDLLEVDFAVYDDGVEACLEISLLDLELEGLSQLGESFEIYGTVKASNSLIIHSGAWSTLFDHITSRRCIKLYHSASGEAEIRVPLTRNVTAIHRNSNLLVDVNLFLYGTSQDEPLVSGSVTFDANSRSSYTVEEQIILGARAKLKVKAICYTNSFLMQLLSDLVFFFSVWMFTLFKLDN